MAVKTLTLQKIYISNKRCSFELCVHQIILKNVSWFPQKNLKQKVFSTFIIIKSIINNCGLIIIVNNQTLNLCTDF